MEISGLGLDLGKNQSMSTVIDVPGMIVRLRIGVWARSISNLVEVPMEGNVRSL